MFWELYQQRSIHAASSSASRAHSKADQVANEVELLENKIDALALACQSLWEIVRDTTDVTQDDMIAKMEEIDMRDGVADGRITPQVQACGQCGRKTSRRRPRCIYCGAEISGNEVFGLR